MTATRAMTLRSDNERSDSIPDVPGVQSTIMTGERSDRKGHEREA